MPIIHRASLRTTRMTAVRDDYDSGAGAGNLVLGTSGMAAELVSIPLDDPSGTISGDVLTLSGFPKDGTASGNGKLLEAKITNSSDVTISSGLTVGLNSTVAPVWAGTTAYVAGDYRSNGANIYKCVTGGTSAGSGGPTGTGTGITDGGVTWDWYCVASANVQMNNIEVNNTQTVTVSASPTITHAS